MSIIEAKPTTYKGTTFRSKSEARVAVMFDLAGIRWEYEPRCFSADIWSDHNGWRPDFKITLLDGCGLLKYSFIVEYKPCKPTEEYLKWWDDQANEVLPLFREFGESEGDPVIIDALLFVLPMHHLEILWKDWSIYSPGHDTSRVDEYLNAISISPLVNTVHRYRRQALHHRFDLIP